MKEIVCIAAGFMAGGFLGVTVMCIFQINAINKYEMKIAKLRKELEKYKRK